MDDTIKLKMPNSSDTISVTRDKIEYYLEKGYTKVTTLDKSNVMKIKPKKEEDK